MKILYCTDLHGDEKKYEKILELAQEEGINTIINGGDILPKIGDRYKVQIDFLENYLPDYFKRLNDAKITYLVMLGNDDLYTYKKIFENLCSEFEYVTDIENNSVQLGDYEIIGMNSILDTPFASKDWIVNETNYNPQPQMSSQGVYSTPDGYELIENWEEKRETLPLMKDVLNALPTPNDPLKTIYITHMPPAGLNLGRIYGGDDWDIGSKDIYDFIKRVQPKLTLHGHLHESPIVGGDFYNNIDDTICIQPGQTEYDEDTMVYLIVDLDNNTFERKITPV